MGIWQLVCATDIKRVARSPERVRKVADAYFEVKMSMRTDLPLAERRARLQEKFHGLLGRVPAHTHAQVRAAQQAAVARLDLLALVEAEARPQGPVSPSSPAPGASPREPATPGRSRLASPGGPRYADVVAGGASLLPSGSPPRPRVTLPPALPSSPGAAVATSAARHAPEAPAPLLGGPRPRSAAAAPEGAPRRSYAEVARQR